MPHKCFACSFAELAKYKIGKLYLDPEELKKLAAEKEARELAAKNAGGMGPIIAVLVVAAAVAYYFLNMM